MEGAKWKGTRPFPRWVVFHSPDWGASRESSSAQIGCDVSGDRLDLTLCQGKPAERGPALSGSEVLARGGIGSEEDPACSNLADPLHDQRRLLRADVAVGDCGDVEQEMPGAWVVFFDRRC